MRSSRLLAACFTASLALTPAGEAAAGASVPLSPGRRAEVVDGLSKALRLYIDPATGGRLEALLAARRDRYLAVGDPGALARLLTDDMRSASRDKHLTVWFGHERWARASASSGPGPGPGDQAVDDAEGHGFSLARRLDGNIGLLDLRSFAGGPDASPLVGAYMALLGHTDAMIVDLRHNHGGAADTIDLLTGALLGKRTLLVRMFFREPDGKISQMDRYSVPPQGPAYKGRVYILTSAETFSAAEEFAYDLQTMKRAVIVGETTGGGAHPGTVLPIATDFTAFVPIGRAEGAVTHTDWEGVGITPDIRVPASSALLEAYRRALAGGVPAVTSEQLDRERTQARADPAAALREDATR